MLAYPGCGFEARLFINNALALDGETTDLVAGLASQLALNVLIVCINLLPLQLLLVVVVEIQIGWHVNIEYLSADLHGLVVFGQLEHLLPFLFFGHGLAI